MKLRQSRGERAVADRETNVIAAEKKRYAAMVAGEIDILDRLLSDDLIYTHSTGARDTKTSYLASLRNRDISYDAIEHVIERVLLIDDAALMFEHMSAQARANGRPVALSSKALAVWHWTGESWVLVAYQPTPVDAGKPVDPGDQRVP